MKLFLNLPFKLPESSALKLLSTLGLASLVIVMTLASVRVIAADGVNGANSNRVPSSLGSSSKGSLESDKAIDVKGQLKNWGSIKNGKQSRENIDFVQIRTDYSDEIELLGRI